MKPEVYTCKSMANMTTEERRVEIAYRVLSMQVMNNLLEMAKTIEIDTPEHKAFDVLFDKIISNIS